MKTDSSATLRAPALLALASLLASGTACGAPQSTPPPTPTSGATSTARGASPVSPDPFVGARRRIAHVESHTCAIQPDGALYCWGENGAGQIGVATPDRALSAVRVPGLPPVVSVAVDALSTCAVGADGSLWCFGFTYGPRRDARPLRTPTRVPGFEGVVGVALGVSHRCALFASGKVACFGDDVGALGGRVDETPERAAVVEGLPALTSLVASNHTTCGLDRSGQAWCFGEDGCGESPDEVTRPYAVPAMTGLSRLTLADDALCGLGAAGDARCVRCTEASSKGQRKERVYLPATQGATSISADAERGCVVVGGRVACWGRLARGWAPGRRPSVIDRSPRLEDKLGLARVVDIAVGDAAACALSEDGNVRCWGENRRGELGAGSLPWATSMGGAERVLPFAGVTSMAASGDVTCVLAGGASAGGRCFGTPAALDVTDATQRVTGGTLVWSTGWDLCSNAGQGEPSCFATNPRSTGPDVAGATWQTTGYASGPDGKCIVLEGKVRCVPVGERTALLDELSRQVGIQAIAFGAEHACVVTTGGLVRCAGKNDQGQLGRAGPGSDRLSTVAGVANATHVVAGNTQSCALTKALDVFCWGIDASVGERKGTSGRRARKVATQVRELTAGRRHFCAADYLWDVWCWGSDERGQLGDGGDARFQFDPIKVPKTGSESIVSVSAGNEHTCVLFSDGTARCWGSNADGQLGDSVARGWYPRPFFVNGLPHTPSAPHATSAKPAPTDLDE